MFINVLKHMIRDGSLRLVDSRGRIHRIGDDSRPVCTVRLRDRLLEYTLAFNPALQVPEAYMDGTLTVEDGTFYDLIDISARNYHHLEAQPLVRAVQHLNPTRSGHRNGFVRARRNVAHHYDLSDDLYALFLDSDRQYSCAYFADGKTDLESAQLAKKRHLASKLLLQPGQKLLDIGSGWGGLGLYLAGLAELDVTGVTLSTEQLTVSERRARDAGLDDRVRFKLQDYRAETGVYDRIVSVGMFEHVGRRSYPAFFRKVKSLLAEDGVMVLHAIGRLDSPSPINPFISKYIFPGADLGALSEVTRAIEPSGLYVTDVEILRLHYAETLRLWRERFMRNRDKAKAIYDERFCRMWEAYMVICEIGFRLMGLMVFQIQLARRIDTVPLTRDYMLAWERAQAEAERVAGAGRPRSVASV